MPHPMVLVRFCHNFTWTKQNVRLHFHSVLWLRQSICMVKKLVLVAGHKPLLSIFGPYKGMPVMATAQLQRYAVFLSHFNFSIVFVKSELHGNTNALSRAIDDSDTTYLQYIGESQIGPYLYLVGVDVFTKWLNIAEVPSTMAIYNISFLNSLMARFGICTQLVSDNGLSIYMGGISDFHTIRGIHHVTSPPYHPQSNGQAENSVKFYKYKLKNLLL
ncbi:hypothetical protein PR048_008634 [Dryococelus australis]|uniref:Integrase catalytic domain-containing protein n=1 Tax=Dryococelus australis TaxID=614101 RepID=A0ABQ9HXM7_9NEOP|nr:hypothetical protein PR048_008634 [Dryococelus australis]